MDADPDWSNQICLMNGEATYWWTFVCFFDLTENAHIWYGLFDLFGPDGPEKG